MGATHSSQGRVSAPWEKTRQDRLPRRGCTEPIRRLCNPFGVGHGGNAFFPGCAGATLGYVVERLRRRAKGFLQTRTGLFNFAALLWSVGARCTRAQYSASHAGFQGDTMRILLVADIHANWPALQA